MKLHIFRLANDLPESFPGFAWGQSQSTPKWVD